MIATQVSRPIRSASASGPSGCAKPELRDRVDRLGLGDAVVQRPDGLVDERHQDPVRDEAREVVGDGRRLAELDAPAAVIASAVSSEVSLPRTTSTSFSTGTGLKKCMPITRSGRAVAAASVRDRDRRGVRGEHGLRRQRLVGAAEDVLLDGRVLDHRLDHQVGRDELVHRLDAREHLVRVGPALLGQLRQALAHRRRARARPRRAPRRGARRGGPRRRRPARSRRPSGPRRRRARARTSRATKLEPRPVGPQPAEAGLGLDQDASPWPPPEQIAARPRPPPLRRSSCTIVPTILPPLAPIGWPSATAPPLTLTFASSAPSSFVEFTRPTRTPR